MEQFIKQGWLGIARLGSAAVYIGVVAFADILFLVLMGSIFPPGPLSALATFGAVAGGLSALVLPIALHHWFAPVKQFAFGVVFLAVEWIVLGLNVLLSYQVWEIAQAAPGLARVDALTRLPDWLAAWAVFSPASPLVALIGWGVVYMLDPAIQLSWAKQIKAIMEMQAEVAQHEGEIEQRQIYNAHFRDAARNSPEVAERLRLGAARDAAIYAAKLTGDAYPVASRPVLDAPATGYASDAPAMPGVATTGDGEKLARQLLETARPYLPAGEYEQALGYIGGARSQAGWEALNTRLVEARKYALISSAQHEQIVRELAPKNP